MSFRGTSFLLWAVLLCARNESDRDMYEDSDDEENDENDTHEAFLVAESDFADHSVEEILGDKKNTKWLLVDNQYICHKHSKSIDDEITFWECKFRRSEKCPFKMATVTLYALETGGAAHHYIHVQTRNSYMFPRSS